MVDGHEATGISDIESILARGTLFHNSATASAIADRLVHKGLLVRITGKSRRSDQEVS